MLFRFPNISYPSCLYIILYYFASTISFDFNFRQVEQAIKVGRWPYLAQPCQPEHRFTGCSSSEFLQIIEVYLIKLYLIPMTYCNIVAFELSRSSDEMWLWMHRSLRTRYTFRSNFHPNEPQVYTAQWYLKFWCKSSIVQWMQLKFVQECSCRHEVFALTILLQIH